MKSLSIKLHEQKQRIKKLLLQCICSLSNYLKNNGLFLYFIEFSIQNK